MRTSLQTAGSVTCRISRYIGYEPSVIDPTSLLPATDTTGDNHNATAHEILLLTQAVHVSEIYMHESVRQEIQCGVESRQYRQ